MAETNTYLSPNLADDERLDEVNENLRLIQKKSGLTYGTDAYLLSAFVRGGSNLTCADLGSGTGIIPLLCARRRKFGHISAIEIQADFAELISRNALLNGLDKNIYVLCRDLREVKPCDIGGEVDVVMSNPPYMRTGAGKRNENDAKYIARHEVCGDIGNFCTTAARLLKFGGQFYCVYRPDRLTDLICSLRKNKLEPKRMTFVCADVSAAPSMVLVEARRGGNVGLNVTETLFLNECGTDGKMKMSKRAEKIYSTCSFE